jgi:uncharacterized protein (UPF0276 family)
LTPSAIGQIHVAGHTQYESFIMDTHVGPVPEPVWALYRRAVARFGEVPTLVEWDTDVPPFEVVAAEAARAREVAKEALGGAPTSRCAARSDATGGVSTLESAHG